MDLRALQFLSISHLILIILNDKEKSDLRKYAEIELKLRLRNVGWNYNDLLHFDDKVISKRGLDVNNYLLSKNVNMQQLMETYFMYDMGADYYSNGLLFSEKHLCNETDLNKQFFNKICTCEIKNINDRLLQTYNSENKDLLILAKEALEDRQKRVSIAKKEQQEEYKTYLGELFCFNEAMYQLDSSDPLFHEFGSNYSDEEEYKLLKSKSGIIKLVFLATLQCTVFENDIVQNISGLHFATKDSRKLYIQKMQLLQQAKSGFVVNYGTDNIKKALKKTI